MWPTASGATQKTKYENVKISLPSTKSIHISNLYNVIQYIQLIIHTQ